MRIFIYEFVTGGGFLGQPRDQVPESLVHEGRAMIAALAEDFSQIAGFQVHVLGDVRFAEPIEAVHVWPVSTLDEHDTAFSELARQADRAIVIAPEFDDLLLQRVARVNESGGRLLGPAVDAVALTADKQSTADHLAAAGIPCVHGLALPAGSTIPAGFSCPAVLKPRYGAGSQSVTLIPAAKDFPTKPVGFAFRLERYVPGLTVSVAVLCSPKTVWPLVACRQLLSDDGRFQYLGGSLPLPTDLARRASELAVAAVQSIDGMLGYVGVDIVLGEGPREDAVIEVNPRLTTSYVGLRVACDQNLAEIMLRLAEGQDVTPTFADTPLQFDSLGRLAAPAAP